MVTLTHRYKVKARKFLTTAAVVLAFVTGCSLGQRLPDTTAPAPAPTSPTTSAVHTTIVGR